MANGAGEIVAKVNGEGTNHWMVGIPEVGRRIAAMSIEAKKAANIPDSVGFKCIGLSLSGCEQDSTNVNLEKEIRKEFPGLAENYVVCSDTLGSILTVSNLGGVVIIAGTGSNACLRNPSGGESKKQTQQTHFMTQALILPSETFQCGGWGHGIGDEGGAWWISYKAIKAVFDHEDNLEICPYDTTVAWDLIKSHFNVEHRRDFLEHCYASFQKSFYARLCQKMSVAASNGDELCQRIFVDAGRQLARMVSALLPRVDQSLIETGHLSIICVGSVWQSWELLKPGFVKELTQRDIPYELRLLQLKPNVSMAIGACFMAADSIDFPMPRDYSQNYEIFFNYAGNGAKLTNGNHI